METNYIELIELATCLSIPNFYCIWKNEINGGLLTNALNPYIINPIKVLLKIGLGYQGLEHTSPTSPNSTTNIIVNLTDSDKNVNGHWCICFIDTKQKFIIHLMEIQFQLKWNNTWLKYMID